MDNLVVGVDESRGAQAAVRWVAHQAALSGARVTAVHVVPRSGLWSLSAMQIDIDKVLADLESRLEGPWVAPLRKAAVPFTTRLVRGDPGKELLRVAARARASLVVLGSKSHGNLSDLVVGGTVHKVINRSPIPVVVVPLVPPAPNRPAQ
jgi:nucleotide-binding universal stress UspA family protein